MLKMTTANIFEGREWGKRMNKSKTALSKKKKKKNLPADWNSKKK